MSSKCGNRFRYLKLINSYFNKKAVRRNTNGFFNLSFFIPVLHDVTSWVFSVVDNLSGTNYLTIAYSRLITMLTSSETTAVASDITFHFNPYSNLLMVPVALKPAFVLP